MNVIERDSAIENLMPDAQRAAPAIEHGLTSCMTDGGFARFPGVRRQNPQS